MTLVCCGLQAFHVASSHQPFYTGPRHTFEIVLLLFLGAAQFKMKLEEAST